MVKTVPVFKSRIGTTLTWSARVIALSCDEILKVLLLLPCLETIYLSILSTPGSVCMLRLPSFVCLQYVLRQSTVFVTTSCTML